MTQPPPSFADLSRHKGKRERTRASLLDAAARLMAELGPEDISISQITSVAGVANGTFYNHFASKSEIIAGTAFGITDQIGAQIHRAAVDDPVEQIAIGGRRFVEFAVAHPTWAWALLRSLDYLPAIRSTVYQHLGETLQRGVQAGVLEAEQDDFTHEILVSMLFAAVRAQLTGAVGPEGASRVAEMQLRLLGASADKAAEIAYRPLERMELRMPETPRAGRTGRSQR